VDPEIGRLHWAALGLVWIVAAFGTGAALAWLYRRLHRELSFYYLWALWTVVASVAALVILALGLA
jgi:hypothetical protein